MKKRLIALLLVFAMSLSLVSPAWAAEGTDSTAEEAASSVYADTAEAENKDIEMPEERSVADIPDISSEEEATEVEAIEKIEPPATEKTEAAVPVEDEGEEAPAEEMLVPEADALLPEEVVTDGPVEDIPQDVTQEEPTEEPTEDVEEVIEEPVEDVPLAPLATTAIGYTYSKDTDEYILTLGDVASENFRQLQEVIAVASLQTKPIRIADSGVYTLAQTSASSKPIYLYPNTTLDLNGATLVRGGLIGNMLCLANADGIHTGEACDDYTMCTNVTVKNGTLDGVGGSGNATNLVNLGHCTNVRFSNVTFLNGKSAHLLEFTGAKDCVVENCTFSGWKPVGTTADPCEAIQIDISYGGADKKWNGIYSPAETLDNAVCRGITITGCTFKDYPGGVGNHHTVNGAHSTDISITGNVFVNSCDFKYNDGTAAIQPAINCYAFDKVTVADNTVTGKYTHGIYIQGGSATITNNRIGTKAHPFPAPAIVGTKNYAWVVGNPNRDQRITQYITGGSVSGNTVYCSANTSAVAFNTHSKLSSIVKNAVSSSRYGLYLISSTVRTIDGNKIVASKDGALYASDSAVTNLTNNTLTATSGGALILSGTKVSTISGNKATSTSGKAFYASGTTFTNILSNTFISSKGYAAHLSGSKVTSLNSNKATSTSGNAFYAASTTFTNVLSNTLTSSSGNAVYLTASKITALSSNKAASTSGNAFYLTGTTVTNMQKNSVSKAGKYGVYLTGKSGVTSKLNSNVISNCGQSGIYATSNSTVKTVQSNKITSCKKYGIAILNKKIKVTVTKNTIKSCKKAVYVKAKGTKQKT